MSAGSTTTLSSPAVPIPATAGARAFLSLACGVDRVVFWAVGAAGVVSLIGLFATIIGGVALRYLTDHGAGWVNELPFLLFPWLCACAFVLAAQAGAHILVEFLHILAPRRIGLAAAALVQLMALGLFCWLTSVGMSVVAITATEFYPILRIPTAWAYGALTLACALLALTSLTGLIRLFASAQDPVFQRRAEFSAKGFDQ